jgi:glycosyltransferase involved in cell wall biosynthesis
MVVTGIMAIKITCVICTYKRPEMLGAAIESMFHQTIPPDEFEVIVVDNNSGDGTETVVKKYQDRAEFPLPYIREAKRGLSYSRNAGVQIARGKFVAFLDDDAEADPRWLSAFLNVFESAPEICVVGGKIIPKWDAIRPKWLTDDLLNNYSMLDLGESRKMLTWPEHVLGTSCFRKSVFDEVGKFEPQLGRIGDMLVGNEDTEIQKRIFRAGKKVAYTPEAVVWHHIPADRLNKKYIYTRAYGTGRSRAVLAGSQKKAGIIIWQFLRGLAGLIYYTVILFWAVWNEGKRIKTVRSIYTKLGFLAQSWQFLIAKFKEKV